MKCQRKRGNVKKEKERAIEEIKKKQKKKKKEPDRGVLFYIWGIEPLGYFMPLYGAK